jgi:hypothetical protein
LSLALDLDVRLWIYERFARRGTAPSSVQIADAFGIEPTEAEASLLRLSRQHDAIVLFPDTTAIWMGEPFSAVPTSFGVHAADGRRWWGNCIWDAFGILGLLGCDGAVETPCPDCEIQLRVEVRDGVLSGDGVVHFAVPAGEWWRDIGFT